MSRKQYLEKREKLTTIDFEYQDLKSLVNELQSILEDFEAKGYYSICIESEREYGYYDEVTTTYVLYGTRRESDKEREKRLEANRKAREAKKIEKEKKIDQDRELFESLKEKYGW